jgi:glycosyltransferase involved in cell wall biosynthesis
MSGRPLLSLCVPTYNRAAMLELMLGSLCSQAAQIRDDVEIVVSDNCSPDRTPQVVATAARVYPIASYRNEANVGSRNFLLAVERATGEYAWVLGDDDLVFAGALRHVMDTLRAHPHVDYFFVNYLSAPIELRDRLIRQSDSVYEAPVERCVVREAEDKPLPSWEHIFDLRTACAAEVNTSILSSVFRRAEWQRCAGLLRMNGSPMVSAADTSLDDLFPHVKILAHAMIGRPGWYIGRPCALMGQGGQEWLSDWPAITIVGTNEAMELYERLGVEPARMRRLWQSHFVRAVEYMPLLGARSGADCMRGFPWGAYLWRNRRRLDVLARVVAWTLHPGTWLKRRVPPPLFAALRSGWHAALRLAAHAPGHAV